MRKTLPPDPRPVRSRPRDSSPRFINPHRLFHGVWLPQWLEERPEVSDKAKKLYAHLTYFAGGKGFAWPSFAHLAEKLHVSRRYVIRLVAELTEHRLITVTNVRQPHRGHCSNEYRFLWHPWMQSQADASFSMTVSEPGCPNDWDRNPGELEVTSPGDLGNTPPGELPITPPGDGRVTPLMIHRSPKENNEKRLKKRGDERGQHDQSPRYNRARKSSPDSISDTQAIVLERRIAELRTEIASAVRRGDIDRALALHAELAKHQNRLGFTPDEDPKLPAAAARNEKVRRSPEPDEPPSPEEVTRRFDELRRQLGVREKS